MYQFTRLARTAKRLKLLLPRKDRTILTAVVTLILCSLVLFEKPSGWLELRVIDAKNLIFSRFFYHAPSSEIFLLAIDAKTLEQSPHPWPWPNSYWAEIINNLSEKYAPEAIIIDVVFQGKKIRQQTLLQPLLKPCIAMAAPDWLEFLKKRLSAAAFNCRNPLPKNNCAKLQHFGDSPNNTRMMMAGFEPSY